MEKSSGEERNEEDLGSTACAPDRRCKLEGCGGTWSQGRPDRVFACDDHDQAMAEAVVARWPSIPWLNAVLGSQLDRCSCCSGGLVVMWVGHLAVLLGYGRAGDGGRTSDIA